VEAHAWAEVAGEVDREGVWVAEVEGAWAEVAGEAAAGGKVRPRSRVHQ
jgi:hypothetical protein